jgi:hypothetical protein
VVAVSFVGFIATIDVNKTVEGEVLIFDLLVEIVLLFLALA